MTTEATNDRNVCLRMPGDLWDALESIASREDRTVSWLIRQACTDYVQKDARALDSSAKAN